MIGATRYYLGNHGWFVLVYADVVIIKVVRGEVLACVEVYDQDWGTMIEKVEGPDIILDWIAREMFVAVDGRSSQLSGVCANAKKRGRRTLS